MKRPPYIYTVTIGNVKEWYMDGKLHREDGPAVEYDDGDEQWYIDGELHRLDGPAVKINGDEEWHLHGKCHRADGPACEYKDGQKLWFWMGKQIICYSDEEFFKLIKLKAFW